MPDLPAQHAIAPALVLRGPGAWQQGLQALPSLVSRPLLLGRSAATAALRRRLAADLEAAGLAAIPAELEYDCCEQDLQRLAAQAQASGVDAVIASGGGKVRDAGKIKARDRIAVLAALNLAFEQTDSAANPEPSPGPATIPADSFSETDNERLGQLLKKLDQALRQDGQLI